MKSREATLLRADGVVALASIVHEDILSKKKSRKQLRNWLTAAEAVLWKFLQRRQFEERSFGDKSA